MAAIVGWNLYKKLTTNTVVAYFPETLALYPGDKVQIMGVKVGSIDKIEPAGDKMKVTFHYDNKYKVPGQRDRVDPEPEPGGLAHHPAVAALHRRPGDGGQRGHPDRPHPGAGRVRRTARLDQPDPRPTSGRRPNSPRGRSATSSSLRRRASPARASSSTRR